MVEVMHMVMFVISMSFSGAQSDFVHLDHGHFHVQVVVDWSRFGWPAGVQCAMRFNDVPYNLMVWAECIINISTNYIMLIINP